MRFRILDLLLATAICGFTCAALVRADSFIACLYFSLTLAAVFAAALCAIGQIGASRAYWLGFAVTSGAYLVFAHVPDVDDQVPRHDGPEITTQLLRLAFNKIHSGTYHTSFSRPSGFFPVTSEEEHVEALGDTMQGWPNNLSLVVQGGQRIVSDGTSKSFMLIGHSAWALLLGWIAGHFTRFIYLRSHRDGVIA